MTDHNPDIRIVQGGDGHAIAVTINGTSHSPAAVEEAVRTAPQYRAAMQELRSLLGLGPDDSHGTIIAAVRSLAAAHRTLLETSARLRPLVGASEGESAFEVLRDHLGDLQSALNLSPMMPLPAVVKRVELLQSELVQASGRMEKAAHQHEKEQAWTKAAEVPEPLARLVRCLRADMAAASAMEAFGRWPGLHGTIRQVIEEALRGHRLETLANLNIALFACAELVPEGEGEEAVEAEL